MQTLRAHIRHLLIRGESVVALVGLGGTGILVLAMGAAAWWNYQSQQELAELAHYEQVHTVSALLADTAEVMLASDDVSPLRRLLVNGLHEYGLSRCRIRLLDGSVIADGNPTAITLTSLPDRWPTAPVDELLSDGGVDGEVRIALPLKVPGRGTALLEVQTSEAGRSSQFWDAQIGLGLIGIAALGALLMVYRAVRRRVLTLGLIQDSLTALHRGETAYDALSVQVYDGPEVNAWNRLLSESAELRKRSASIHTQETLQDRRQGGGNLEQACDALSVGMVIVDQEANIRYANGAAAALLRHTRNDICDKPLPSLIKDENLAQSLQAALTEVPTPRRVLESTDASPGAGVLRFHIRPLRRIDLPSGCLVTVEDITQQKVADESRNSFIAQATHELRAPLTNMRLYLESVLEDGEDDPVSCAQCLNVLNQETRRLERMVGEMLSVAQIEAGSLVLKCDDVRLDRLFDELREDYIPQAAERQITLRFELPPKLPVIRGDRDRLALTLHNLISNALKYTVSPGEVTVTVISTPSTLSVDVADTGIGIRPEERDLIFQRFYRAQDPRVAAITGTGLGLALAREVARLHGGEITMSSEPNKGSTFTLSLPIAEPRSGAARAA